ncbi:complement factor H-related protein 5-like isoform X15 [Anolis sagrei]|uniref:complement factor H-related protein 5-like isoform X15 n=1 Tax=Anolis sagrei TaxID=38937 RepID=UPI0035211548
MRNWLICIALFLRWMCCISQGKITCEPPNIAHGGVRNSKTIYRDGERIQISCDDGYRPADRDDATCTWDGWNTRVECIAIVCRQPQIDNGNIRPKQLLYQYQDSIDTSCEAGYRNTDTSFCTAHGWQPPPACIPKHCEYPRVQNGRVYEWQSSFPKRPGSTLYFSCDNGFLPEDKNTGTWHLSYCTTRGWQPEPKCFKQCDPPRRIPHGFLNYYQRPLIEGNVISYGCDRGYSPANQQTTTTCTKNGWFPTPSCIAQVLEIPHGCQKTPLPNGFFTAHKEVFSVSEKVRYKCLDGYTTPNRVEEEEIQCLQTGWNQEPKCIKTCQKPYEANVDFDENQSFFLSQEILHYKCKEGFQVSKTAVDGHIQCTENGWDSRPACVAIECDVPILGNGNIEGKEQFANGDVVKFSCKKGYSRVGPDSAQCYYFGWSPLPPVCKETVKSCQQPPSISNGTVAGDLLDEYQHGEKLFYECDIGFVMSGSNTVECVDGEWTSLPSCTEEVKFCGKPPAIRHGRTVGVDSNSDRYAHYETVKYECSPTYFLVGTNPARCLHGKWKLPECSKKCKRPTDIKFGPSASRSMYFDNNTVISYSCGVSLHETKCVNGKWFPEPECTELCSPPPQLPNAINIIETRNYKNGEEVGFTCMKHFLLQGPPKISCEYGRWQTPPRCIDQRCENPPSIDNGVVETISQNKYIPGQTVEYHCLEGFEISGSSFAICENAKWHHVPACKVYTGKCGRPPSIENGDIIDLLKQEYESGESVTYKCQRFYAMEGNAVVSCQDGHWSEPPECKVPCTTTEEDMERNNIRLKWSRAEKIYNSDGDVVEFMCKRGYSPVVPLDRFRVRCANGIIEYPRCE